MTRLSGVCRADSLRARAFSLRSKPFSRDPWTWRHLRYRLGTQGASLVNSDRWLFRFHWRTCRSSVSDRLPTGSLVPQTTPHRFFSTPFIRSVSIRQERVVATGHFAPVPNSATRSVARCQIWFRLNFTVRFIRPGLIIETRFQVELSQLHMRPISRRRNALSSPSPGLGGKWDCFSV